MATVTTILVMKKTVFIYLYYIIANGFDGL